MKRKDYQRPTMQVVKLQHKCQMLTGSGPVQATMSGKFTETDGWDEE